MNNSNRRYGKHFSLIVVLFILLIIVGASYYC
ncbi:MAG TPA: YjcZ family sporulation protein [Candidatus Avamphibacillus intestinigallinarum]|nr:YjcZ family sporulation protein [Candidatus Avamphibacillus intestinigallinarum]